MSDMESDLESVPRPLGSRKLRPSGGSMVLTIPPAAMRQAAVEEDDELNISVPEKGKIVLSINSE